MLNTSGCIPSITRANTLESGFQDGRIQTNGTANSSPYKRTEDEFYIIRKYDERSTDKIEMNQVRNDSVSIIRDADRRLFFSSTELYRATRDCLQPKLSVSLNEDRPTEQYSPVMNPQNNPQTNNLRTPGKGKGGILRFILFCDRPFFMILFFVHTTENSKNGGAEPKSNASAIPLIEVEPAGVRVLKWAVRVSDYA